MMTTNHPASILQRLAAHLEDQPTKKLFSYLGDKGEETRSYTYAEFEGVTSALASALVAERAVGGWGVKRGECVLLVYPPSLDFIVAFVACLRAGVVAVPVYPPNPFRLSKDVVMFIQVQSSSGAAVALTNTTYGWAKRAAAIKQRFSASKGKGKWPELRWLVTDKDVPTPRAPVVLTPPGADELAFLQYTSGSTSAPKGVMVSHGALSHNLSVIVRALEASKGTVVVSWLPQYHDMGLIGSHLGVLYCGGQGWYMSPISFIKNPPLWLQAISKYRGTHMQAPNFAYKLTVRKVLAAEAKQRRKGAKDGELLRDGLDLSCARHIFNAAEPVDGDAIDAFVEAFAPCGLKREAIVPGYGLAEHTVYVCDGGWQRLSLDKRALEMRGVVRNIVDENELKAEAEASNLARLVGCGMPHRHPKGQGVDIRVVIADPESREQLPQGRVGEVWVTSPSKAYGYYGLEEKSRNELRAKLEPPAAAVGEGEGGGSDDDAEACAAVKAASEGGEVLSEADVDGLRSLEWLRTGDLGFLYRDELFICGRIKDLIIIRGRNHYPQDIELSAESSAGETSVRPGCCAAFAVEPEGSATQGNEMLVIVAEPVFSTSISHSHPARPHATRSEA